MVNYTYLNCRVRNTRTLSRCVCDTHMTRLYLHYLFCFGHGRKTFQCSQVLHQTVIYDQFLDLSQFFSLFTKLFIVLVNADCLFLTNFHFYFLQLLVNFAVYNTIVVQYCWVKIAFFVLICQNKEKKITEQGFFLWNTPQRLFNFSLLKYY